jgi:acyl-coenzyme A thioesterase PaaI-like protein
MLAPSAASGNHLTVSFSARYLRPVIERRLVALAEVGLQAQ